MGECSIVVRESQEERALCFHQRERLGESQFYVKRLIVLKQKKRDFERSTLCEDKVPVCYVFKG